MTRAGPAGRQRRRRRHANARRGARIRRCTNPAPTAAAHTRPRRRRSLITRSKSEMIMIDKIEEESYTTIGGAVRVCAFAAACQRCRARAAQTHRRAQLAG